MLLIFINNIPPARRLGILTLFNFANATVFFAGSALGGLLLSLGGADKPAYMVLFLASSLARAAVLAWFALKPSHAAAALPGSQHKEATAAEPAESPVLRPTVAAVRSQTGAPADVAALSGVTAAVAATTTSSTAVPSTAAGAVGSVPESVAQTTNAAA
mgnify:CR=1 FL=1